jgi:hypothetical protein
MMNEQLLDTFSKIRKDAYVFATELVYTKDEKDLKEPIKKFPADLEYLKLYFRVWQRERLVAVPKSRRMFLSWATLILYLHDTMFNVGRQTAVVSQKEEDADDLLQRMVFILENIPASFPKELIPKWKKTFCCLEFPEIESRILAFPSGADQLRSYAASGILADECAFWKEAKRMYSATFPIIEDTGRMTMISSAAPGFFKELVFDEFDGVEADESLGHKKFPLPGVEVWRNPKNKFTVVQIHYTANPHKRDGTYRDKMKSGMPLATFNQEFEISWETYAGKQVYPDWNKAVHGSKQVLSPHIGLPILLGVDWGLTPACIMAQLQGNQLVIFDEVVEENMGAEKFTEKVYKHIATHYPGWAADTKRSIIAFVDPAGNQRQQADDLTTCIIKFSKYFKCVPGPVTFEARKEGVEYFLTKFEKGKPTLQVDMGKCKVLVGGFDGGYHYPEKQFEIEPLKPRPEKNKFSHPHDALQYLAASVAPRKNKSRVGSIPSPGYNFSSMGAA